jgi:uncharacterized repeat protein (TIGR03803 family)
MKSALRPFESSSRFHDFIGYEKFTRWVVAGGGALILVVVLLCGLVSPAAHAQTFTTLYNFAGPPDGADPYGGVIRDADGNLYGTTYQGGYLSCKDAYHPYGCGTVFKVSVDGSETVLHLFTGGTADGEFPFGTVLRDEDGTLYGATGAGGMGGCSTTWGELGCGVVFKIDAAGNESILYNFQGGTKDGCYPAQGLVMDKCGYLYGTTQGCGATNNGTVFKLSKNGKEVLLHSFSGGDGGNPSYGKLLLADNGDLYGVTSGQSTTESCGTLYRVTRKGKFTLLHVFGEAGDGCFPMGTPGMDASGNIYGTTAEGGNPGVSGTIWKLDERNAKVETVLHSFHGGSGDGEYPEAGVVLDPKGNVYGNTATGGWYGLGTLWELTKDGEFTLLYSFSNGNWIMGDVLRDDRGLLSGTTAGGGTYGYGTVWSYKKCER